MARTYQVKAFRGQRKCQHERCGEPLNAHKLRLRDEGTFPTLSDEATITDHPFTQKPLRCEACGENINIGDPYKWVAPRPHRAARGFKRIRHRSCPGWKPSDLTSSQHLATIYAAQEAADDDIARLNLPVDKDETEAFADSLEEIANAAGDSIQEAADSYRESAEAIEEGFGHPTYQSEELETKAYDVEGWAEDIRSVDIERFDGTEECAICSMPEDDDSHQDEDSDEFHEWDASTEPAETWAMEQIDVLTEVLGSSPV